MKITLPTFNPWQQKEILGNLKKCKFTVVVNNPQCSIGNKLNFELNYELNLSN